MVLQAMSNEQISAQEAEELQAAEAAKISEQTLTSLAGFIRQQFWSYRDARVEEGIDLRIQASLRVYNGKYEDSKRKDIASFGGSSVYSRLTTVKCRGTTAMLRDIFLGTERPWGLKPTPVPQTPIGVDEQAAQVLNAELLQLENAGQPYPQEGEIQQRLKQIKKELKKDLELQTEEATESAENALQDILEQGGFYQALNDFLMDLPIYPYAILKGPVVRYANKIKWVDGQMQSVSEPRMFWERVDPINIYLSPGVSQTADADVIERIKLSRNDLRHLLGVEGYRDDAIRAVLTEHSTGLVDWIDQVDTTYAAEQSKENPYRNRSNLISGLEYTGYVKGSMLLDYGVTSDLVTDEDVDYGVTCWLIGRHVIKIHINENPSRLHNYYISSFEKVPGTIVGHGLPEILSDIQNVANAALRALNNNMSIASGPQVAINESLLSPNCNGDELVPWKRWKFTRDEFGQQSTIPPISFFQPKSNARELLGIYQEMTVIADEISAIPRYLTGSTNIGSAGQTASGLSMLMNNASKVLQNIAANIDRDIMMPALQQLYMDVMLSDDSVGLVGDEEIIVQGVSVAIQRETDRMRQLEFLQITNNEVDMGIIGPKGRSAVLGALANNLGLPGNEIVPNARELENKIAEQEAKMQAQQEQMQEAEQAKQTGIHTQKNPRVAEAMDNQQRTRTPGAINRQAGI